MADYRLTDSDLVIRVIDCAAIPADPENADRAKYEAWLAEGGEPDPFVRPPAPVPAAISDRQFFQQLALIGTITQAEALAAVKVGTIPPALQDFVDAFEDPEQQFAANMLLAGATIFERGHPLTAAIGAAQGMSEPAVDDFFRAAAAL